MLLTLMELRIGDNLNDSYDTRLVVHNADERGSPHNGSLVALNAVIKGMIVPHASAAGQGP